jgi:hypothetical protein
MELGVVYKESKPIGFVDVCPICDTWQVGKGDLNYQQDAPVHNINI